MNHENTHLEPNITESPIYSIPETRDYSPETDVDRSLATDKLGSKVVNIVIEQTPFNRETLVEVHHAEVDMIKVPTEWIDSTPVSEPGTAVEGTSDRGKAVFTTHPNARRVFGHPSNTTDQQIRNIAGR